MCLERKSELIKKIWRTYQVLNREVWWGSQFATPLLYLSPHWYIALLYIPMKCLLLLLYILIILDIAGLIKVYTTIRKYVLSYISYPSVSSSLDIIPFILDTTQTTPGPSQNMDYITKWCRATTCHECTVSSYKCYNVYYHC